MPLTLIKETGDGLVDANSYADAADGTAYHAGHLYPAAWTEADAATQEAALVMATRLIDALFHFKGFRRLSTQALQWPRRWVPDPDNDAGSVFAGLPSGPFFNETTVPKIIVDATCELARTLIEDDRTSDPDDQGLKAIAVTGAVNIDFNARTRRQIASEVVRALLAKVGDYIGGHSGNVKLLRS
ncbi:hypothetical protein GC207_13575 [bacterium]|nr:hypothetical protein [bacterium]